MRLTRGLHNLQIENYREYKIVFIKRKQGFSEDPLRE